MNRQYPSLLPPCFLFSTEFMMIPVKLKVEYQLFIQSSQNTTFNKTKGENVHYNNLTFKVP